jgi:hypothetical protein
MTFQPATPLHADALEANRGGRLTDTQRADWTSYDRGWRKNELVGAGICAVLGVLLLNAGFQAHGSPSQLLLGVAFFVGAAFFVIRGVLNLDPLSADLRAGTVDSVEGAVAKSLGYTSGRSTSQTYFAEVDRQRFTIHQRTYEALPSAGIVRLFYLPRSRKVVNFEQLPDRPLAPEAVAALSSPAGALGMAASALMKRDPRERAEAMASMAALGHAIQAEMGPSDAAPPPADQRDPRPLADAILGTWRMGPLTVTFAPDGNATLDTAGIERKGPWSVGSDGRLHSPAFGPDAVADAWVSGDTLTVRVDGRSMAFHRAPAG